MADVNSGDLDPRTAALLSRPPALLARAVSVTLSLFTLLAITYASFAHMDVVVTAQGRVVPAGRVLVVQGGASGTLRTVHVRDGGRVRAGDRIADFTPGERAPTANAGAFVAPTPAEAGAVPPLLDARLLESLARLSALEADAVRRRAERDGAAEGLARLDDGLRLLDRKHRMREELARTGHMTQTGLIETSLEIVHLRKEFDAQRQRLREAEAALNAAIQQKTQVEAEYRARYPAELVGFARQAWTKQGAMLSLVAPADGVVQWLSPPAVGDRVLPGQNLLLIVPPEAALGVEALVLNKDIGHLRPGQRAVVKVETFDYTRYGHLDAEVRWVGGDVIADPKQGPVYVARIALAGNETPYAIGGRRGQLTAGMNATVDVRVEERRMIEYFLAPLLRYKEESLRER